MYRHFGEVELNWSQRKHDVFISDYNERNLKSTIQERVQLVWTPEPDVAPVPERGTNF